jgi:hypothetical protein
MIIILFSKEILSKVIQINNNNNKTNIDDYQYLYAACNILPVFKKSFLLSQVHINLSIYSSI